MTWRDLIGPLRRRAAPVVCLRCGPMSAEPTVALVVLGNGKGCWYAGLCETHFRETHAVIGFTFPLPEDGAAYEH